MHANHFDTLTRLLGARGARRSALTGFLGFAALRTVAGFEPGSAKAKCKKPCGPCRRCKNKKCRPKPAGTPCSGGTCRDGECFPTSACPAPCTGGRVCNSTSGQCECPPDFPHAGGFCDSTCRECCIDDHCGRFTGKKCDHTQGSICVCANASNYDCGLLCTTCCVEEHCVPILGAQSRCVDGGCRCNPGLTACFDPVSGQNKCTNTVTDPNNCGECGRDCPAGTQCVDATCA